MDKIRIAIDTSITGDYTSVTIARINKDNKTTIILSKLYSKDHEIPAIEISCGGEYINERNV